MLPWLRNMYSKPSVLAVVSKGQVHTSTLNGKDLLSQVGPRQGDPLGCILYAFGTHSNLRLLRQASDDHLVLAYVDNLTIIAPRDQVVGLVLRAKDLMETKTSIKVNLLSSGAYAPQGEVPHELIQLGIKDRGDGMIMLGCPVGTDEYIQHHLLTINQAHPLPNWVAPALANASTKASTPPRSR